MEKNEKKCDAVAMMRRIREEISQEIAGMSFEEQKQYLREEQEKEKAGGATAGEVKEAV